MRGAELQAPSSSRHLQRRRRGAECHRPARERRPNHAEPAGDADRALRRPERDQRQRLAVPRHRSPVDQRPVRAVAAGGLLLQDVHVAEAVVARLRRGDPPRRRPRTGAEGTGPGHLRPDAHPLRRAGGGRRPGGPRRRAGGRTNRRARDRRGRAERARRPAARQPSADRRRSGSRLGRGGHGGARGHGGCQRAHAHDGLRTLRAQPRRPAGTAYRPSGAGRARSAPAPLEGAGQAGRARRRRTRASHRIPQQRQARRNAGLGGRSLRQPLRGQARPARGRVHQQRRRLRRGGGSRRRRRVGRGDRRCPARRGRRGRGPGRDARYRNPERLRRRRREGPAAGSGSQRLGPERRRRGHGRFHAHDRLRPAGRFGGLEPLRPPALPFGRQAGFRCGPRLLRAGKDATRIAGRRRRRGRVRPRRVPGERVRGRRGGGPGRRNRAAGDAPARCRRQTEPRRP